MAQILEKPSISKFGIFAKNICQIMTNCMDKHYLPNFSQISFGKFMAKRTLITHSVAELEFYSNGFKLQVTMVMVNNNDYHFPIIFVTSYFKVVLLTKNILY